MRAVLICVLAVLALACVKTAVNGLPTDNGGLDFFAKRPKICEPGTLKALDCNTCRCSDRGTDWECTLMGCPEHYPQHRLKREVDSPTNRPKICEPGSTKALDCNTCFCTADGTAWGCTLMGCPEHYPQHRLKREVDSPTKRPKICEPGSTKALDCNTCFCTADGTAWGCTLMGCSEHYIQQRPKRAEADSQFVESDVLKLSGSLGNEKCEPGSRKFDGCNTCTCTLDGSGWGCTRKLCEEGRIEIVDSGKHSKRSAGPGFPAELKPRVASS
ncbi:pacifastin-like protease inhibitor cvp4 isoform X1 [Neodiprion lecontei]|uniref:Pacifastin-like protease inhibitor cvp4 isoform X1 n=1 Tax=Neodiprion lecontei TaxID=441921 RepID=A0ABM3G1N4_NEOLC|nr:pacifastin-like protease inhibitor cvp4 isoform X1 [Neodiprion lecontei]